MTAPALGAVAGLCAACAAACCWGPAWLAAPAAGLLLIVLPGRLVTWLLADPRDAQASASETRGSFGWGAALGAGVVLAPLWMCWLWRFDQRFASLLSAALSTCGLLLMLCAWRMPRQDAQTQVATAPRSAIANAPAGAAGMWRAGRLMHGLLLAYVFLTVLLTFWLPRIADRAAPQPAHDFVKHHAVVWSLCSGPLPLRNIFYAGEPQTPYYYYEYHHYLAAGLRTLCQHRISIPLAFGLCSALTAVAFLQVVSLIARRLGCGDAGTLAAAACASVVGGWDILAVGVRMALGEGPSIIVDSWCPIPWRAHNLMTQFVWCPQHVAAVLCFLLAALWLSVRPTAHWWLIIGPLLAASIFGSSVYLAMLFFLCAAVYCLMRLARPSRARLSLLAGVLAIGMLGAILMLSQALGYAEMSSRLPGGLTLQWERCDIALLGRIAPPGPIANYLDAPWLLLIDLGPPAVALLLLGRRLIYRCWRDQGLVLLVLAAALGTLALYTVRSDVNPFDYSFRVAIKPLQVLAALAAGLLVHDRLSALRRPRHALIALSAVGVLPALAPGLYEAPLMAIRTLARNPIYSQETAAILWARTNLPPDAVLQGDPLQRLALPQLTDRRAAVLDAASSHVRVFYPRNPAALETAEQQLRDVFAGRAPDASEALRAAGATHVYVGLCERDQTGADPAWIADARLRIVYRDAVVAILRVEPVE